MPAWVWSEHLVLDAASRLAQLHQASASFDTTGAVRQIPVGVKVPWQAVNRRGAGAGAGVGQPVPDLVCLGDQQRGQPGHLDPG